MKSATSLCSQVAAEVPDLYCNCYLVNRHIISSNSATTEASEKTQIRNPWNFIIFCVRLTKYESYQILLKKISHRILVTPSTNVGG
jgi:hypothetical protein